LDFLCDATCSFAWICGISNGSPDDEQVCAGRYRIGWCDNAFLITRGISRRANAWCHEQRVWTKHVAKVCRFRRGRDKPANPSVPCESRDAFDLGRRCKIDPDVREIPSVERRQHCHSKDGEWRGGASGFFSGAFEHRAATVGMHREVTDAQ
jgi:hypothetical protein